MNDIQPSIIAKLVDEDLYQTMLYPNEFKDRSPRTRQRIIADLENPESRASLENPEARAKFDSDPKYKKYYSDKLKSEAPPIPSVRFLYYAPTFRLEALNGALKDRLKVGGSLSVSNGGIDVQSIVVTDLQWMFELYDMQHKTSASVVDQVYASLSVLSQDESSAVAISTAKAVLSGILQRCLPYVANDPYSLVKCMHVLEALSPADS
jgi:hypothetical protein